ncbi:MAG: F0F1 ATP synthase subunit B [Candidatus Omnitrophica bacterium]|nr:F0F1 ATP synthase subunit B [Candidatus Omnitrophota bacterium]
MELLKLLSTNEIIAQVISFLILLFLLRAFAWKNILALLDKRKEKISSELNNIEKVKQEVAKLKQDYESKLDVIEDAVRKKMQDAVAEGRKITEEIHKKAHQEAQEIIDSARANIKYELTKAKEELKNNVIDLTIMATENIIQEKLTDEGDKKLIKDFLQRADKIE